MRTTVPSVDNTPAVLCLGRLAEARFGAPVVSVMPLAGDASGRRYVRLAHTGAFPATSVGMILPEPFKPGELPFLDVAAHFREIGQPVPEIYGADGIEGVLLLEDGGDMLLETAWHRTGWAGTKGVYREAVDLLVRLQTAPEEGNEDRLALRRAFDQALFLHELHHTRRFAFEKLLGIETRETIFAKPFEALVEALCVMPYRLTHRDYHSRNLLVREGGRLMVLDFQDARRGPVPYDLVSLVYDSYVTLSLPCREMLVQRFWDAAGRHTFPDRGAFDRALALTGLQRNLKAIGTFAYQKVECGNPRYLSSIPGTVASVRLHLERLPDWHAFGKMLNPYLEALARPEEPSR